MLLKENITSLYVSQIKGISENNGFSPDTPLCSIEAALSVIREVRNSGHRQPISIKIMDAEYFINAPVIMDESIFDVTLEPYTQTQISGGIRIKNFKADQFNGVSCLSAKIEGVKEGKFWFTDFYVNGKAAAFTRYPESDFMYAKDVENNGEKLYDHSKWFIAQDEDLAAIKDFRNFGDCFISFNHYWVDEHTPIESYDISTGKIVFKYSSRFNIEPNNPSAKLRYIIENVAEAFKNPGEWYLDRPSGKVYYIPREGESIENLNAYAPITDKLFVLQGTKEKKVSGIIIRNFTMNCTKGDYRSRYKEMDASHDVYVYDEDFEGYASDIQSVCWAHGSIEMRYAHNCALEDCVLTNMGVHAINIDEGSDHIYITNNEIHETGGGGIKIDGSEPHMDASTFTQDIYIRNNLITHCGNRYFAACGILLKHAFNCEISHNEISYIYYTGISVGWSWRYEPCVTQDVRVEKNHIHHIGQGKLSDMGGIYLLSEQPGTIVRGNLIHDVESKHYGGWGIYPDEGSSYLVIENNICYNITSNCLHNHYGRHNTVRNNIFVRSGNCVALLGQGEYHVSDIFQNNILVSDGQPFFGIGTMYIGRGKSGPLTAEDKTVSENIFGTPILSINNLLYDVSNPAQHFMRYRDKEFAVHYTVEQAKNELALDDGSIVADPMFVDYESHDYRLKSASPAFKLGFKQIDMSDVGRIKK